MSPIRMLEREDLPRVCQLYERVIRSGRCDPPPQLADYFKRTFFDCPWADPDIPSLVFEDPAGEIVGFVGSHVRRLLVDGRPVRMACGGQLVSAPESRRRGIGALLMRRYLAGPQDFTITDGATDLVRRMLAGFGGQTLVHASVGWTSVFRPGAAAASWSSQRKGGSVLARSLGLVAPGLDAAAARLAGRCAKLIPDKPAAEAELLTVEALLKQMADASRSLRLHPDYDASYLHWLFSELEAVDVRGVPVRHLVHDRRGKVAGWYIYYLAPGGIAQALQVAAPGGNPDLVLDHLLWHAARRGAAAVQGRIEPVLFGSLRRSRFLLSQSQLALVHCEDPKVLGLLGSTKSMLTRLDGEWWMGHHLLWRAADSRYTGWTAVMR